VGDISLLCVGGEAAGQYAPVPRKRLRHDEYVRVIVREPLPPVPLSVGSEPISDSKIVAYSYDYRVTQFQADGGMLFFLRAPNLTAWDALNALLIDYRKHNA